MKLDQRNEKVVFLLEDQGLDTSLDPCLKAAGYKLVEAKNSDEALERLQYRVREGLPNPLCFVVDLKLRWMDEGLEFCQKLLNRDAGSPNLFADIPIIILTGERIEKEDIERGLTLGVWDYLLKPFASNLLTLRIKHAIEHAEVAREGRLQCEEAVIVTDRDGKVLWKSEQVRPLLQPFYKAGEGEAEAQLPEKLSSHLQECIRNACFEPIILDSPEGQMLIRVEKHQTRPDHYRIRLRLAPVPQTEAQEMAAFGRLLQEKAHCRLAPRQIEAAYWYANDRTHDEVGQILGISGQTVRGYIKEVFKKIGEYLDNSQTTFILILQEVRQANES